jgi:hypothetical protein
MSVLPRVDQHLRLLLLPYPRILRGIAQYQILRDLHHSRLLHRRYLKLDHRKVLQEDNARHLHHQCQQMFGQQRPRGFANRWPMQKEPQQRVRLQTPLQHSIPVKELPGQNVRHRSRKDI